MKFESVYRRKDSANVLYKLLSERTPEQSISHKGMPTLEEHLKFIALKPYHAWYLIVDEDETVGSIYLTKQREIGIFIFNKFQKQGYAEEAIKLLMEKWPGRFLANVNPLNVPSIGLFNKMGFKLIQQTYAL